MGGRYFWDSVLRGVSASWHPKSYEIAYSELFAEPHAFAYPEPLAIAFAEPLAVANAVTLD